MDPCEWPGARTPTGPGWVGRPRIITLLLYYLLDLPEQTCPKINAGV